MKTFKYIIISSIVIFLLCIPTHFMYEWISFKIIGFFFPVNESIFQHMKMVFLCFLIFYLALRIFKERLEFNNLFISNLISSISCIISFLIIYIPVYLLFKENMIFTFILLFLSIAFGQFISTFFLFKENNINLNNVSLIIIIFIILINGILTIKPLKNFFFWDEKNGTYYAANKK